MWAAGDIQEVSIAVATVVSVERIESMIDILPEGFVWRSAGYAGKLKLKVGDDGLDFSI
jgi:hypothetical protein